MRFQLLQRSFAAMLKGQDIVVALVLVDHPGAAYAALGERVGLSPSAVHRAMSRLGASGLVDPARRHVVRTHLVEFLVHGARYVFPAAAGASTRGVACGVSVLAEGGTSRGSRRRPTRMARTTRPRSRIIHVAHGRERRRHRRAPPPRCCGCRFGLEPGCPPCRGCVSVPRAVSAEPQASRRWGSRLESRANCAKRVRSLGSATDRVLPRRTMRRHVRRPRRRGIGADAPPLSRKCRAGAHSRSAQQQRPELPSSAEASCCIGSRCTDEEHAHGPSL